MLLLCSYLFNGQNHHHYMIFFQFLFRAMEQIGTDTLLYPHRVGGRVTVVNETETQKTRSALALQDILKIGSHAWSWHLGCGEAASRRSNFNHSPFIADEPVDWKAPPLELTQVTTQSPLHSHTTKISLSQQVYPLYPRILHLYCIVRAKRLSWAGGTEWTSNVPSPVSPPSKPNKLLRIYSTMSRSLICFNWQILVGKHPELTIFWIVGVVLAPSTVEVLQEFDVVGAPVDGFRRIFRSLLPPDTPICFGDSLGNEGVMAERFTYVPELMESEETLRTVGYDRPNAHKLWRVWQRLDKETKRREYHGDKLSSTYSFFSFAIRSMECECAIYRDDNDDMGWKELLENVGVNRSLINEVMDPENEIARRSRKGRTLVPELISANCRALCYVRWASYWRASEEFASQVFDMEFGNTESLPTPNLTQFLVYFRTMLSSD